MEPDGTNLGDIYRKKVFLRGRAAQQHYNSLYNSLEFLFHFPEAIIKVLGVRTPREYLNLMPGLSSSVFTREGRITGVYVSLVARIDNL